MSWIYDLAMREIIIKLKETLNVRKRTDYVPNCRLWNLILWLTLAFPLLFLLSGVQREGGGGVGEFHPRTGI